MAAIDSTGKAHLKHETTGIIVQPVQHFAGVRVCVCARVCAGRGSSVGTRVSVWRLAKRDAMRRCAFIISPGEGGACRAREEGPREARARGEATRTKVGPAAGNLAYARRTPAPRVFE